MNDCERRENLSFSEALHYLKNFDKVCRVGWNGKGMFLMLVQGSGYRVHVPVVEGVILPLLPWIGMKTADNCFVPWLASQTDILAEDWMVCP